jgi:hypothetical protein
MSLHSDFMNELHKHLDGDIRLDPASRILPGTDASIYQIEPRGVASTKSQADLPAAVQPESKYSVWILPRRHP